MGTVIDRVDIAHPRWHGRHSALHLAVTAAKDCLRQAGCDAEWMSASGQSHGWSGNEL